MRQEQKRGSSKLGAMSHDDLHKAIGAARESYKIERWWKYGQPAIDRVAAVLDVSNVATVGSIIENIIKLQGIERQIGVVVFPYGIPVVDGVRLELSIDEASH